MKQIWVKHCVDKKIYSKMYWRKRWLEEQKCIWIDKRICISICWYWLGSAACVWLEYLISLVSACSDTSSFLCSPFLLIGFTITSQFHLQIQSPLCLLFVHVCACVYVSAHTGFKLQTRQDSKWKEILSLCLACHFLAHLIYYSGQGLLLNSITATPTQHAKTHVLA